MLPPLDPVPGWSDPWETTDHGGIKQAELPNGYKRSVVESPPDRTFFPRWKKAMRKAMTPEQKKEFFARRMVDRAATIFAGWLIGKIGGWASELGSWGIHHGWLALHHVLLVLHGHR